ncbi:cation diffusion facilitator family transporter [uncultured Olegusella sp.]|uniref:cation diffusion facilitator family transporter n=1 Tax=uncultured Olegusella sp. TaxID=1979846 RepID=UPI002618067D|nr:cation diffusion facilitator family transporter [uncultured Olegusella sp.]
MSKNPQQKAEQSKQPLDRIAIGRHASIVCIICNVTLATAKALAGIAAGSVSVIADAVNNLSDASSNIISLIGFQLAGRPADAEHPYGHGRYEYVAGLVVALLVMAMGLELLKSSIEKLIYPSPTDFGILTGVALLASISLKLWMMHYTRKVGKQISSKTLEAAAIDSRNDTLTTTGVLIAVLITRLTGINLDGWAGLAMSAFVIYSGIQLVKDTVDPLLGHAPSAQKVEHIRRRILSYPGVLATHDLMVHDYGPGRQFASAHVEMAAERNPLETHKIVDQIEQDFLSQDGLHLVLHYDPIITCDPEHTYLHNSIAHRIRSIDPRLTIHDIHVKGSLNDKKAGATISFDCMRPQGLPMTDDELREALNRVLKPLIGNSTLSIIIDEGYLHIADAANSKEHEHPQG